MSKRDYREIGVFLKTHAESEVAADSMTDRYFISQDYTMCLNSDADVSVCIKFLDFDTKEELSESGGIMTDDVNFMFVFIGCDGADEGLDELMDDALRDFRWYFSLERQCNESSGYICDTELIEWLKVRRGSKGIDKVRGIYAIMTVTARLMEV